MKSSCPANETIVAVASGQASSAAQETVDTHIRECGVCEMIFIDAAEAARTIELHSSVSVQALAVP